MSTFSRVVKRGEVTISGPVDPRPTRYLELGYRPNGPGLWRIVDLTAGPDADGYFMAQTGPLYRTRAELLADLDRYAAEFGCK